MSYLLIGFNDFQGPMRPFRDPAESLGQGVKVALRQLMWKTAWLRRW